MMWGLGSQWARADQKGEEEHVNREGLGPAPMWRVTTHPLVTVLSGFFRRRGSRGVAQGAGQYYKLYSQIFWGWILVLSPHELGELSKPLCASVSHT